MKTARLLFSTSRHPLSGIVRAGTRSRWSHVGLIDGNSVIEATATHGVVRTRLFESLARASEFAFVELPCTDPAAAIAMAAGEIGKPYDWSGVFGIGFNRDWQEDDAWFCSELVAWAFEETLQPLLRSEVLRRVTPQHLWMLPPAQGTPARYPLNFSTLTN